MDIARRLLMTTLVGIKNGTVRPDLTQCYILEEAGLVRNGLLTAVANAMLDPRLTEVQAVRA